MATVDLHSLQVCRMRLARLESDGTPDAGTGNLAVTDQLITMTVGVELSEGDDFEQKNGCGAVCLTYKDCDRVKRLTLSMDLCTAEPQITELVIGAGDVLTNGSGDAVGYAYPEVGSSDCPLGVSTEIWTKNISDGTVDPVLPWIWWVAPKTFWQFGDKTFENNPMVHSFTGFGQQNENWGNGPGNDWDYISNRIFQYAASADDPPAAVAGTQTLVAS